MRGARIVTRATWRRAHSGRVDVVAIVIGIAMFAILLAIIEGIERI
jgi:hypothetical protein